MAFQPTGRGPSRASTIPDLAAFERVLSSEGLRGALRFLNRRTPHRFTGVFRFDGDMLRNVALVDKWHPEVQVGEDVPLALAYCSHLHRTGEPIEVSDGRSDPRTVSMKNSPVVSYCGAPIRDLAGHPWGALCHFDNASCDAKESDLPLLTAAAGMLFAASCALASSCPGPD